MIFSNKEFPLRTSTQYKNCYNQTKDGIYEYGFMGKPLLNDILEFPNSLPIDYMHLICLGTFKNFTKFWFDSKNKRMPYYIGI